MAMGRKKKSRSVGQRGEHYYCTRVILIHIINFIIAIPEGRQGETRNTMREKEREQEQMIKWKGYK